MSVTLNNLKQFKGAYKRRKRIGRGNASGHGSYSTQGQKGQRARSGGSAGLKRLGLAQMLKKSPKFKGQKPRYAKKAIVNLDQLESAFEEGAVVSAKHLIAKDIIRSGGNGLKILGQGKITKKLTVVADSFSDAAKEAIIKAGGKAVLTRGK